jgi:hypothetical protein
MRLAFHESLSTEDRRVFRRRAITLALVLTAHLLIMILLFQPGEPIRRLLKIEPKVFSVMTFTEAKNVEKPAPRAKKAGARTKPRPQPSTLPRPTAQPAPTKPLNMMFVSHDDFAAADISRMPRHAAAAAAAGDNGVGSSADGADAVGTGPGGEKLYKAEWYVEPSSAELRPYLPNGTTGKSWGEIACRTISHFHVEDCHELAESPPGSGLARALRQAAWQFLVRPPRVGGRAMVGTWVSIRFTFSNKDDDKTAE